MLGETQLRSEAAAPWRQLVDSTAQKRSLQMATEIQQKRNDLILLEGSHIMLPAKKLTFLPHKGTVAFF